MKIIEWVKNIRMLDWWVIGVVLVGIIAVLAPQQIGVAVFKVTLVSLAAVAGYWVDRSLFPYARPHEQTTELTKAASWVRRAMIISAAMIAVGMGA